MEKITPQQIVAIDSMPQARALIIKYGYAPATSVDDLIYKLDRMVAEHGEVALKDIAEIHPHRDLIGYYLEQDIRKEISSLPKEKCSCTSIKKKSSFEGASNNGNTSNLSNQNNESTILSKTLMSNNTLIIGGLFALAITVIALKK
jgi:hypothetical protein